MVKSYCNDRRSRHNGKNLWCISISTVSTPPSFPLPLPPRGVKPSPSLTLSSGLTPTNTSEGTATHFFPSHMANNKQLPDKQRKTEIFLGDCQEITIHVGWWLGFLELFVRQGGVGKKKKKTFHRAWKVGQSFVEKKSSQILVGLEEHLFSKMFIILVSPDNLVDFSEPFTGENVICDGHN